VHIFSGINFKTLVFSDVHGRILTIFLENFDKLASEFLRVLKR